MIDLKFIQFYVESFHNKSMEEYFHVERSTVSNWRKRGMPKRYLLTFIDMEKSDDIDELFTRIYPKNEIKDMTEKQKLSIDILVDIKVNRSLLESSEHFNNNPLLGLKYFNEIKVRLEEKNLIKRSDNSEYYLTKNGEDIIKNNNLILKIF